MTWGWTVKGDNLGTPAESAVKASWPDYNAEYLQKKLSSRGRRYNPGALDDTQRGVYLQETIKGYKGEAEACLKAEFEDWLQGTHAENVAAENGGGYYFNNDADTDGGPRRRHVYEGAVSTEIQDDPSGSLGTGWRATRWGTKQLTNLDGVRDYLRAGRIAKDNAERDMNLLAERGPQDLNEAWMYFKHWVKRRPVSTCDEKGPPGSNFDKLTRHGVDRMNGTGPSNWVTRDTVSGVGRPTTLFGPEMQWTRPAETPDEENQQLDYYPVPLADAYYPVPSVTPQLEYQAPSPSIASSQKTQVPSSYSPFVPYSPDPPSATDMYFETANNALRKAEVAMQDLEAAADTPLPQDISRWTYPSKMEDGSWQELEEIGPRTARRRRRSLDKRVEDEPL